MSGHKPQPSPISKIIETHFRKIGADKELFLYQIFIHWNDIVGEKLSKRSQPKSLKNGRLVVTVTDPGWMTQLKFMTRQISDSINKLIGKIMVNEIFLVVGELEKDPEKNIEPFKTRNLKPDENKLLCEATEHIADPEFKELIERIVKKHLLHNTH
ncbi:MAG: hypothetical protein A3F16_05915 [Deltaproteobacteria bacterium RIFCSPHIGHO2_12_FULL_43_9]|nr:MAG: hypothetical protein A3F16_05915 [Deltaproteobacteria bacterium RIFCSPHIGHO2_12_FULL_43_9]